MNKFTVEPEKQITVTYDHRNARVTLPNGDPLTYLKSVTVREDNEERVATLEVYAPIIKHTENNIAHGE